MWIILQDCDECQGTGKNIADVFSTGEYGYANYLNAYTCSECGGSGERQYKEEDYHYETEEGVRKDYPDAIQVFKTRYK